MAVRRIWRLLASFDLREFAAIACTALIVPAAALAGLALPVNPSGVVAPILEAPRALFGGVRDTTKGFVRLVAGPEQETPAVEERGRPGPPTQFVVATTAPAPQLVPAPPGDGSGEGDPFSPGPAGSSGGRSPEIAPVAGPGWGPAPSVPPIPPAGRDRPVTRLPAPA